MYELQAPINNYVENVKAIKKLLSIKINLPNERFQGSLIACVN